MLLIGILLALFGVMMTAIAFHLNFVVIPRERARDRRMLASSGIIVSTLESLKNDTPMVRFQARNGNLVTAPIPPWDEGPFLMPREEVTLRYDPDDPRIIRVDGQPSWRNIVPIARFLIVLGPVWTIASAVIAVLSIKSG